MIMIDTTDGGSGGGGGGDDDNGPYDVLCRAAMNVLLSFRFRQASGLASTSTFDFVRVDNTKQLFRLIQRAIIFASKKLHVV